MNEHWASSMILETKPHQTVVLVRKDGKVLMEVEVVEPRPNQNFVLFKEPGRKHKEAYKQAVMFVVDDLGQLVAQDQVCQ